MGSWMNLQNSDGNIPLLSVEKLSLFFQNGSKRNYPVRDVSFQINAGDTLGIVGESGSGKTLTVMALLGLIPAGAFWESGKIKFWGKEVTYHSEEPTFFGLRGKHISMVFQESSPALNPVIRVGRQIRDVIGQHLKLSKDQASSRVLNLLSRVGLPDVERIYRAYPHQLSGGMAQRVMIAMALSCEPQLIIADEPTTALDVMSRLKVLELLGELQQKHRFALILISHDINVVGQLADSVVVMQKGRIVERGSIKEVFHHPQHHFTKKLIHSSNLMEPEAIVAASKMEVESVHADSI